MGAGRMARSGEEEAEGEALGGPPFLTLPTGTTKTLLPPSAHSKEEFGGNQKNTAFVFKTGTNYNLEVS